MRKQRISGRAQAIQSRPLIGFRTVRRVGVNSSSPNSALSECSDGAGTRTPVRVDQPRDQKDWEAIRRICCSTAKAGGTPIEAVRWPFFSEVWIGPYQKLRPEWSYVLRGGDGQVGGYLTSAPDTRRFERERAYRFNLPMIFKVLFRLYDSNLDTGRFLRRALGKEASPETRFSVAVQARLAREFPAHLHINLDSGFRKKGGGSLLIERLLRDLLVCGVPGVHLYCAAGPVKFYLAQGFETLEKIEVAPGVPVYAMARTSK